METNCTLLKLLVVCTLPKALPITKLHQATSINKFHKRTPYSSGDMLQTVNYTEIAYIMHIRYLISINCAKNVSSAYMARAPSYHQVLSMHALQLRRYAADKNLPAGHWTEK